MGFTGWGAEVVLSVQPVASAGIAPVTERTCCTTSTTGWLTWG